MGAEQRAELGGWRMPLMRSQNLDVRDFSSVLNGARGEVMVGDGFQTLFCFSAENTKSECFVFALCAFTSATTPQFTYTQLLFLANLGASVKPRQCNVEHTLWELGCGREAFTPPKMILTCHHVVPTRCLSFMAFLRDSWLRVSCEAFQSSTEYSVSWCRKPPSLQSVPLHPANPNAHTQ